MNADLVDFVLEDAQGSALDDGGAGATYAGTPLGAQTATLTTVAVTAPEFDSMSMLTGSTIAAVTNVTGSPGGNFGINNLSISNGAFNTATGAGGSESVNFNFQETWTFNFDQDVTFTTIDFASLGGNETFEVNIGGTGGSDFTFADGAAGDIFNDPFAGLLITAGTNITFVADGSLQTTNLRIDSFQVHVAVVPEPSTAMFGCVAALGLLSRRRR